MDMLPAGLIDPEPTDPAELLARADALRDRRDWAEAAQAYAAYLRHRREHWQIWVQYGHCMKESGDPKAALLLYREAERLQPEDADVHLQIGHALKILGRAEEACQEYARALTLDPGNAAARAELMAAEPPAAPVEAVVKAQAAAEAAPEAGSAAPPAASAVPKAGPAFIFDASDLLSYFRGDRAPTGIQRVQLNIIEQALLQPPAGGEAAIVCFDAASGGWKPVPEALFRRLAQLSRSGTTVTEPAWTEALALAEDAVRNGPAMEFPPGQPAGQSRHLLVAAGLPAPGAGGEGTLRPALRTADL